MSGTPDGTAYERITAALRDHGCRGHINSGQASLTCPAHEDSNPSLSVTRSDDRTLINCHAGCATDDILATISLTAADLFDTPREQSNGHKVTASYLYTDEQGTVLYVKERRYPKTFVQYLPLPGGGKGWKLGTTRRVLYRLPDVIAAVAEDTPIWITEGEKDADALTRAGVCATTWTEGAWAEGTRPKWRADYTDTLKGATITIVADNDDTGRNTARDIAAALEPVAARLRIVTAKEGKDAADHLAAGHNLTDFIPLHLNDQAADDDSDAPPSDHPTDDTLDEEALKHARHILELQRATHLASELRAKQLAASMVAAEHRVPIPAPYSLANLLAIEFPPLQWHIDGLLPVEGLALFSAPQKAGKTTTIGNLVRALADGEPYLDVFDVPGPRRVTLIDTETGERRLQEWLTDQGIQRPENVRVLSLRGAETSLDPMDADVRASWVDTLHGSDVVILDVAGPVVAALGLDENSNEHVARFWTAYRAMLAQAGVTSGVVVHHTGHNETRAVGASAWLRYPDTVWKIERETDDPTSTRYFSAYGRDVDVWQGRLEFDSATRHLTYVPEGKTKSLQRRALDVLVDHLTAVGPLNKTACNAYLAEQGHGGEFKHRAMYGRAVAEGRLRTWLVGRSEMFGVPGLHFDHGTP